LFFLALLQAAKERIIMITAGIRTN
jgi:hypothetical protein